MNEPNEKKKGSKMNPKGPHYKMSEEELTAFIIQNDPFMEHLPTHDLKSKLDYVKGIKLTALYIHAYKVAFPSVESPIKS